MTDTKRHIMTLFNTRLLYLAFGTALFGNNLQAQPIAEPANVHNEDVLLQFPELEYTPIKGAPVLSKPMLVQGPRSEGHGLAAPAFWDWDGDGLKDLLIGEFGSGVEKGRYVGNFIRVYKNTGTETQPEFNSTFDYARPPYEILSDGTPYSVDQFCCIGFTPQFIDLNKDGLQDMITGGYHGEVSWFQGSKEGFKPGEALPQEGNPRSADRVKKWHQFYWLYSSASFGDFTGDGKADLIIGGRALRISKNVGTDTDPQFAKREMLLDVKGNPLKVYNYTAEDLKFYEDRKILGYEPCPAGDDDLSPYVVDWDNDGVLDLMATNSYAHKDLATITFFKGVKVNDEHRFQPGQVLFKTKTPSDKAFPGSGPRVSVADWNNDGINDLLIGASVVTVGGQVNARFTWSWEKEQGLLPAGKDPANLNDLPAETLKRYKATTTPPNGMTIDDFMTIRHRGYVYVMLGNKAQSSLAVPIKSSKAGKTGK